MILDSKDSRSGHWELELPREQTETILRAVIRDIVEETFLSGDDLAAVIEDAEQAELTQLALTATRAEYMPFD